MNREIKFRIWDKEKEYFVKDDEYSRRYFLNMKGKPFVCIFDFCESRIKELEAFEFEVNMYTGTKDSRNKEVYEGDILLSANENGIFLQLIGFGDSDREYDNFIKGFKITEGKYLGDVLEDVTIPEVIRNIVIDEKIPTQVMDDFTYTDDGWWVIGNKYENPELIKLLR